MQTTDLSHYDNPEYHPGANALVRLLWYVTNVLFFLNPLNPVSSVKVALLRLFGAKVGKGVVIKPSVNIKYPWRLTIGNYSWIGEGVWIDNLNDVIIGNHCCLSQGVLLLTGSHDYKKSGFFLLTGKILLEDGVWLGAKSVVSKNVTCKSHAILSINSVATRDMDAYCIYAGNPAVKLKERIINE